MRKVIGSSPISSTIKKKPHQKVWFLFYYGGDMDSNPTKCNADERCRRGLDRGEPLFSFAGERKCKSSPILSGQHSCPKSPILDLSISCHTIRCGVLFLSWSYSVASLADNPSCCPLHKGGFLFPVGLGVGASIARPFDPHPSRRCRDTFSREKA